MTLEQVYREPDYSEIDPVLCKWADAHTLRIDSDYKGYIVRSVWWKERIQIWIDPPDIEGFATVNAAERRPDLTTQWGRSLKVRATLGELESTLNSVWAQVNGWS